MKNIFKIKKKINKNVFKINISLFYLKKKLYVKHKRI